MRNPWLLLGIVFLLSALAAGAYPTFDGTTGLVTLPTAEVAPAGAVDFAVDFQNLSGMKLFPVRVSSGLTDRLELSAAYTRILNEEEMRTRDSFVTSVSPLISKYAGSWIYADSLWSIGGKYALLQEGRDKVGLAVGGSFGQVDSWERVDISKFYTVVTKTLSRGAGSTRPLKIKGHAGLMWGKVGEPLEQTSTRPFLGMELIGKKGGSLGLEYRWEDEDLDTKSLFSAVLRHPLTEGKQPVWVEAGTTNGALAGVGLDEQKFFIGFGYEFPSK